ncbi:MAG: hypothetical protein AMXMBFR7_49720 [Planctomycetota bacterium]
MFNGIQKLADLPSRREGAADLPALDPAARRMLLSALLKGVSRAFYLTVRVLPPALREPIGLAYLLARAADTIADSRLLPGDRRLDLLLAFRRQLLQAPRQSELARIAAELTAAQAPADERTLLESLPQAFALLEEIEPADRTEVRRIVVTLTQGMECDLRFFPQEDAGRVAALCAPGDLDDYTYYVAGCVGEFWTRMLAAHEPALRGVNLDGLTRDGVRFGKALQLTNILRDLPKDLRIGRCYLPADELREQGLEPEALLDAGRGERAKRLLDAGLRAALAHFEAAEAYTLALPRRCIRLRLAVLWPILIGLGTLERVARNPRWLDPDARAKVSRGFVYRTMLLSLPVVCCNTVLRGWMRRGRRKVESALAAQA